MKIVLLFRIKLNQDKRQLWLSERSHAMAKKKLVKGLWTKSEVTLLTKLFPSNPTAEVASRLGRSLDTVKKKASRIELKKSKKYMKSLGRK
jgi:hypothetical protein